MGTTPNFASIPHVGSIVNSATNDTSLTAPTNIATVFTAGTSGSRIDTVRLMQVASSAAAGIINLFLFDGTNYHLIDQYTYGIATLSATSEQQPIDIYYQNLVFATGWSLRVTNTANSAAIFNVIAFGGDF